MKMPRSTALSSGAGNPRMKTTPIAVQRTTRPSSHRVLTSFEPGKMAPVLYIPLLREDSVAGASFQISIEMKETVEVLMNAVNVRALTYLVPKTAQERFDGMDSVNKSYAGVPNTEGGSVIPWFDTLTLVGGNAGAIPILKTMGKHAREGQTINTEAIEAYNCIWNFRAKNRSPDIALRARLDQSLAPAFWLHQNFAHIVPDFDQAVLDGEVALNVVNSKMPVKGIGTTGAVSTGVNGVVKESGDTGSTTTTYPVYYGTQTPGGSGVNTNLIVKGVSGDLNRPDVWAELQNNGITVSLSNIDMARKTQAFAELRRSYTGHSDEYIIDHLMDGLTVPEQAWQQPMLLSDISTVIGMSKRYATDSGNLTESVVNGMTMLDVRFNCPRVPMGGVIMMVIEVSPDQLFERQKDTYLHTTTVEALPAFLRDTLDPEKVEIVKNEDVDLDHDTPNGTFGYAPMNHAWAKSMPQIGGKFYRPEVDAAFDEDRQRIWAVETANPVLSEDFYLCTTMHQKPFVVTTGDNFEALIRGEAAIRGNTVFGGLLIEATNDYAKVVEQQPTDRIEKE